MPEYIALGDGFTICIRVYDEPIVNTHSSRNSIRQYPATYLDRVYRVHHRVLLLTPVNRPP
jgi:hypothetical protein